MNPFTLRCDKRLVFLAVFFVALALRVVFVFQWNHTPYGAMPFLDARLNDDWAQAIAQGQLLRLRAFYTSPLYPYALGALYAVFGHSLLLAGLFNALLSALFAAVLSVLAYDCFGFKSAVVTGILAAFFRPLVFYTAPILKESLLLLLLALFLMFAVRALRQNRLRDAALAGALLGFCALARGNVLLLASIVFAFGFFKWRRRFLGSGALFAIVLLLCIAPATIHNYIVSGDFVPLNYDDGFNFYIGNSPTANGANEYPPEISTDPVQEELGGIAEAREARGHDVGPSEVSTYWRDKAVDFILHNPMRDLVLLKNKFLAFWNNAEISDSYDSYSFQSDFGTLVSGPLLPFWPISCLAAFGVGAAYLKRREEVTLLAGFAFVYMLSVLLFYVTDRYRLPVVVFLLPLAGAAVPSGVWLVRAKAWRSLMAAAVLAIVFLFLGLRTAADAVDTSAILPENSDVQVFIRGALTEESRGHYAHAERLLKAAMQRYPADGVINYNYGCLKVLQGDFPAALAAFQKAIDLKPTYVLAYYEQAKIYEKIGGHAHAIASVQHGLEANPSDPLLLQALAELRGK
jgi:tetratricopeptide (TPR) repeat protein